MIGSTIRLLFKRVPLCVEANSCTCCVGRTSTNRDDEGAAARSSFPHRLVSTDGVACLGRFAGGDGTRRFEWPLELASQSVVGNFDGAPDDGFADGFLMSLGRIHANIFWESDWSVGSSLQISSKLLIVRLHS